MFRLYDFGIFHSLPGQLRKCLPVRHASRLLRPKPILLTVRRIPDPVDEKVGYEQRPKGPLIPRICARCVVCEVDGAVTVAERNSSHVPEDQHEAQLLVVHVPSWDDALFAFGTCIRVQEVRQQQEPDIATHIPEVLVLPGCCAERQEKEDVPGYANLEKHLDVEYAENSWVQFGSHEEVVDWVARHAVLRSSCDG